MNKINLLNNNFKLIFILIGFIIAQNIFSSEQEEILKSHIVQLKITQQEPNYLFPWQSKKPRTIAATGIIVSSKKENYILTLTSLIDYQTSIEVKKSSSYNALPATPVKIDYESNLTLLKVNDPSFFQDLKPIQLAPRVEINQTILIYQLDNSGTIQSSTGRLSGIDVDTLPKGHTELPFLNIVSNEKLEGLGEVIVKDNQVTGIVFEFSRNNQGRAIPGFIIQTFLNSDITKKGTVFPYKGFKFKPILDNATKEYFGLDLKKDGVLVAELIPYSSSNELQLNDIITDVGQYQIDAKGYFMHPDYGKQSLAYIAHAGEHLGYKIGSKLPLKIIRNKKPMEVKLDLKQFPTKAIKIPYKHTFGNQPHYIIEGGFLFVEFSEFLLKEWGMAWRTKVSKKLLYLNDYHKLHKNNEKGKIILLTQVMPDESNSGYHHLSMQMVTLVGDKNVRSLKELKYRIDHTKDKFIVIQLEDGTEIVLDKTKLADINASISKKFDIPKLNNF